MSNGATQAYLEGTLVTLAGTNRSAITDREGRYQLYGLPAGPATLMVSFSRLDEQQIPVAVPAGQTFSRNVELTSSIYHREKFMVAGEREDSQGGCASRRPRV